MKARMATPVTITVLCALAQFLGTPTAAQAYINAGFRSEGDYRQYLNYEETVHTTLARYAEAIKRNPKDAVAYYQRARAWESLPAYNGPWPDNQPERRLAKSYQALRDYDQAIALDASFSRAYLRRAALLWTARQYPRALQDLRQTIRREPKWALAHAYLASAYTACPEKKYRDQAKALKHATRACRLSAHADAACLQVLAAVRARAGDCKAAVKWQSKAVAVLGDSLLAISARRRLAKYKEQHDNPSPFSLRELEQASQSKTK
jgi:tetratricopeptide (TPR) repeat protein